MQPSTYIFGQDSTRERHFVIRTESPRFIAEFVEPDEADDGLILEDGEGLSVSQWLDAPQPSSHLIPLLHEIYKGLTDYSDNQELQNPRPKSSELPLDAL